MKPQNCRMSIRCHRCTRCTIVEWLLSRGSHGAHAHRMVWLFYKNEPLTFRGSNDDLPCGTYARFTVSGMDWALVVMEVNTANSRRTFDPMLIDVSSDVQSLHLILP